MRTPRLYQWGITLFSLIAAFSAYSQSRRIVSNSTPRFEQFTLPGGETANNVQCIVQDQTGFLWFASQNGLHRYDGQQMVSYHHDPLDSTSLASDYVEWICLDRQGLLWLGYPDRGMSVFDPVTEKCIHFTNDPKNPNSLSDNAVNMIMQDREGSIWVATSRGLSRLLDRNTGLFKNFYHSPDPGSLSYDVVRSLYVDKSGTLWVGCGVPWDSNDPQHQLGGLNRYNPADSSFTRFLHIPGDTNSLADNRVRALFEDSHGNFWVGTAGAGLHRMDRNTGKFTRLPFDPAHPGRLGSPVLQRNRSLFPENYHIAFIAEDQNKRIWIGASEGGLNVYDPATGAVQHFEQAAGRQDSLQSSTVWQFCQTSDGVIWLSCGNGGWAVYRVKNNSELFPFVDARQPGIRHLNVTGILQDAAGYIWLQTLGDFTGVLRFDRKNNTWKRFSYEPAAVNRDFLDYFELGTDPGGNIWASTETGLYTLTPAQANSGPACFRLDTTLDKAINFPSPYPPVFDRSDNMWIATFGDGLYCFDRQFKRLAHFRHDPADPASIGGDQVEKVFEDSRGQLWVQGGSVGTEADHPMFFDRIDPGPAAGTWRFTHQLRPGEMGDPAWSVEDANGNFWFSAFPYGLRKLDLKTPDYKRFTVDNSDLAINGISDLIQGNDGNIWMLGKSAIIQFNPETERFFTYSARHGVHPFAFFFPGYCKGAGGELFFGGENGFHAFFPEEVHRMAGRVPTNIRITGLSIQGKWVVPGKHAVLSRPIWETSELFLGYTSNVFAFNVACFDFNGPELSRLEFMLEHYDRDWRRDLREGRASYVNVPPGEYTFRVRGANSLGVWDLKGASLRVIVLPPWWRSWWAYSLYGLLIAAGLYAFYHFQLRQKLEHAETLRLRELDTVKTRLYDNITHEFRTPLTLLIGPTERLLREQQVDGEVRDVLQLVGRNARRLLTLVNQMLDLSKLESGKMTLHLIQGDILSYLRYLIESFHSMAENKNIRIHLLSGLEALTMDYDEDKFQQIVSNLLSNALKFTPEGGQVYVTLEQTAAPQTGPGNLGKPSSISSGSRQPAYLVLAVRDTGIGIPEDQLPRIFDRFYQVDSEGSGQTRATEGTGIGLALTRELVKRMNGKISVKSRPDWGTEFQVLLPVIRSETPIGAAVWPTREKTAPAPAESKMAPLLPTTGHARNEDAPLVLLVEDNSDVVAYLASCLPNYRLAAAKDGLEGVDIAYEEVPDIIISDVMMPRKDGFDLCRTLKNDLRTSHIPIILLTAKADFGSKLEGLEHGADAFLAKPFQQEELLVRVRKLLENRHNLQQHYRFMAGLAETAVPPKEMLSTVDLDHAFVKKARAAVEEHLDDANFDVEKFCRALTLSPSQVHRKLSALTGFSATRFMRYVRLVRAKELLQDSNYTITAIAFDTGFSDPAYFSRVFKQEFGMPPQEWREGLS